MLELYQKESCPYCYRVRLFFEEIGVDYCIKPMPDGSPRRSELRDLGGKEQVPFLVDTDKNVKMYESEDIINYVQENYGK